MIHRNSMILYLNSRNRTYSSKNHVYYLYKYIYTHELGYLLFLVATKQLYESFGPSVWLSVRPSHIFDYVPIIVSSRNFQELLPMTKVTSMQKGQRSKVKVTEVIKTSKFTQIGRFRAVTPVWIHQWLRNDAQSLKEHGRGAMLFLKVIRQTPRSHG